MNDLFVNIKVDREERPDVDAIYMAALHELGEQGGWPLTMFLTSDAEPFWGGTYFPKDSRFGRPAFTDALREVARVYSEEPEKIRQNADLLKKRLEPQPRAKGEAPAAGQLAELALRMVRAVDTENGGLIGAPKFPQSLFFEFLWRAGLRYGIAAPCDAADLTLAHVAQGGIYDHLGGGFSRYTVDGRWLVPHFEKMLYDNALLIDLMTELWRERRVALYQDRVTETIDWLLREMVTPEGGFASSLDADSEGEEGKFYVWEAAEIEEVLGADDAAFFALAYDVRPEGNWEGKTILNRLGAIDPLTDDEESRLAGLRRELLARREQRVRPGLDDKVLADWNGLMIGALAKAAEIFNKPAWAKAAVAAFDHVLKVMNDDGRLRHSARGGRPGAAGTATDYANIIHAALRMHSLTGHMRYLDQALVWANTLQRHHAAEGGGYYLAADDADDVLVRMLNAADEATPNANGVMAANHVALAGLTGDASHLDRARAILSVFAGDVGTNVFTHASLLSAAIEYDAPQSVVIAAAKRGEARGLRSVLRDVSLPGAVVQSIEAKSAVLPGSAAEGKTPVDGKPAAYVCIGPQCSAPVTAKADFLDTLRETRIVKL